MPKIKNFLKKLIITIITIKIIIIKIRMYKLKILIACRKN